MMQTFNIPVTQEHIRNAGSGSHECPIAQALLDAGFTDVSVGRTVFASYEGVALLGTALASAVRFMVQYDRATLSRIGALGFYADQMAPEPTVVQIEFDMGPMQRRPTPTELPLEAVAT